MKKILFGLAIVLGIVSLAAWQGNGLGIKSEADNSQTEEEQISVEERLGLKFSE